MDQDRIFNIIAREMGILVEFSLTERKCVHSQYIGLKMLTAELK